MIYDISMPLNKEVQVYKNKQEKKPIFTTDSDFSTGSAYESRLSMNLHTGTHIDFPLHMMEGGKTSDTFVLERIFSSALVVEINIKKNVISKSDLLDLDIKEKDIILFKTKNSFSDEFISDFTYLDSSGAEYLAKKKVGGVGTDGLGIERAQLDHSTHKTLLSQGILIIEGLRLKDILPGRYELVLMPLSIQGVEALPARAVLITI